MPSRVDPNHPATGVAVSKAKERANWEAAKDEIEALQAAVETLEGVPPGSADASTTSYKHALAGARSRTVHSRLVDQPVSILDFISSESDRTAIRNGTNTNDLTSVFHTARDQIQSAFQDPYAGTLYLPRGKYFVNFENVAPPFIHLRGERGGTILESHAAGGFAIVHRGDYPTPPWNRPKYENLGFTGFGSTKGGIYAVRLIDLISCGFMRCAIGVMANDTYYGTLRDCHFWENDVAVMMATRAEGNLAISDLLTFNGDSHSITLPVPNDETGQHAGNKKLYNCYMGSNRIGLFLGGDGGAPGVDVYGGSIEGGHVGILIEQSSQTEIGVLYDGWHQAIEVNGVWFEGNGAWGQTTTVAGVTARQAAVHVVRGTAVLNHCTLFGSGLSAVGQGEIVLDLCDAPPNHHIDGRGAIRYDRGAFVNTAVMNTSVTARRPRPTLEDNQAAAVVTATVHNQRTRLPPRHGRVVVADDLTGTDFASGLLELRNATATWQVDDGIFEGAGCLELEVSNNGGLDVGGPGGGGSIGSALNPNKVHVLWMAVKPVGQSLTLSFPNGLFNTPNWTLPADEWHPIALLAATPGAVPYGLIIWSTRHSSESRTWRVSGIQLLEFDSRVEAAEWVGGMAFHTVQQR
jgi:hypothetical protein